MLKTDDKTNLLDLMAKLDAESEATPVDPHDPFAVTEQDVDEVVADIPPARRATTDLPPDEHRTADERQFQDQVLYGDALTHLRTLPSGIVQTTVCSPPYFGARQYVPGQQSAAKEIGHESQPEEYVAKLVAVFRGVRRVLKDHGTLWINIGDAFWNQSPIRSNGGEAFEATYTGGKITEGKRRSTAGHPILKEKDLVGIPWRLASALQADGWWIRSDCIWAKTSFRPEGRGAHDRPTQSHEHIFLLTKAETYFYEPETPLRSVWAMAPAHHDGAHRATFPPELAATCIKAGSRPGDLVLDCFVGSGTTLAVAQNLDRRYLGIELYEHYRSDIESRTRRAATVSQERAVFEAMMALDDTGEGPRLPEPTQTNRNLDDKE